MAQTLYWYDLETFGRHPGWDKTAQFAGIRTDEEFNQIGDPFLLYCRIPEDYLPDPRSCMVTGITPQETLEKGISEFQFISEINREFSVPGTCVAGYNSIRFDDEFIRNLYYRNFFDPYKREYSRGSSRWDLINLARAAHDLRPEGINWPNSPEGKPSFRLEELTAANAIEHEGAHDALVDVRATIALAKLIYEKQPKLFKFGYRIRKKDEARKQIDLVNNEPFLHTSGIHTSARGCTTIVSPLTIDPKNRNSVLCFDLREDPTPLIDLNVEEIRERIFTPKDDNPDRKRLPIFGIALNQAPFIAPLATLDEERAEVLGLNIQSCQANGKILQNAKGIIQKILKVFESEIPKGSTDPDLQIYSGGFFHDDDRESFQRVHQIINNEPPEHLRDLNLAFQDPRIPEMIWRFRGRNFPESLDETEEHKWKSYCAGRILFPPIEVGLDMGKYNKVIAACSESRTLTPGQKVTLKALDEYGKTIKKEVLDYNE
ncbi:MAG: exodeoxyribonuclease I [Spirochaetales bacterium]|nr:exodeoxyribonuclease I [Spirochaetales bacterium]